MDCITIDGAIDKALTFYLLLCTSVHNKYVKNYKTTLISKNIIAVKNNLNIQIEVTNNFLYLLRIFKQMYIIQ